MRGAGKLFKAGLISGQANCSETFSEPANCFDVGVGYNYGDYLDYFTSDDPVSCQLRCRDYRGCSHFSYYTSNSECYMKTGNQAEWLHSKSQIRSEVLVTPALLCRKDTAQGTHSPLLGEFLAFYCVFVA